MKGENMAHNMTVTIEDELWTRMKRLSEVRWAAVMKAAAMEKVEALEILQKAVEKNKLSEKEIEEFAVRLGKKINRAVAERYKHHK